jgi:hypothetical protein
MPGNYVCSASFKGRCPSDQVLKVCDGSLPLKSILTKTQRAVYAASAPDGIAMASLVPLGPTFLLRIKKQPIEFDRLVCIELWLYPDGSRVLEISTVGLPEEGFQLAAHFKATSPHAVFRPMQRQRRKQPRPCNISRSDCRIAAQWRAKARSHARFACLRRKPDSPHATTFRSSDAPRWAAGAGMPAPDDVAVVSSDLAYARLQTFSLVRILER